MPETSQLTKEEWVAEARRIALEEWKWKEGVSGQDAYFESLYDSYFVESQYTPREALEEDCSYA